MIKQVFFTRQLFVSLVIVLFALVGASSINIYTQNSFNRVTENPIAYSPQFFKWITGGFWTSAVDAMWIETLQLISQAGENHSEVSKRARDFYDLATDLDPYFYELYEQAGVLFLFYLEEPDPAAHILEKGIAVLKTRQPPKAFWTHPETLYVLLAYVYAYQKNDWAKAKAIFLEVSDLPTAPPYTKNMRIWLEKEGSERILARKTLEWMMNTTKDETLKQKYREKLKQYE
jgi:hypothetical protein